uniref:ATP-binding cassette domain-containing protein n=1 Tax=Thermus tengchongensis TaxID=1214928 RepID=A0A7V4AL92_9DEIN
MEPPLLEAQGLRKRFGALEAVRGVSLALRPGEVLAFLGKNGAGKTTPVKMLSGLLLPLAPGAALARRMLAEGAPLDPAPLFLSFLNGLVYLGVGLFLFRRAVRLAKRRGLLHGY